MGFIVVLIYVAAPYSHKDPEVVEARMNAFADYMAKIIAAGEHPVSPLMNHFLGDRSQTFPLTWEYWEEYSRKLLSRCDRIDVLQIDGWEESTGLTAEIELAKSLGIEVNYPEIKLR